MRTTVRLDDDLLQAAKRHAAAGGTTLTSVIEQALRRELERATAPSDDAPYRVDAFRSGLRDGVDLDDSAALLDLMENG